MLRTTNGDNVAFAENNKKNRKKTEIVFGSENDNSIWVLSHRLVSKTQRFCFVPFWKNGEQIIRWCEKKCQKQTF